MRFAPRPHLDLNKGVLESLSMTLDNMRLKPRKAIGHDGDVRVDMKEEMGGMSTNKLL